MPLDSPTVAGVLALVLLVVGFLAILTIWEGMPLVMFLGIIAGILCLLITLGGVWWLCRPNWCLRVNGWPKGYTQAAQDESLAMNPFTLSEEP